MIDLTTKKKSDRTSTTFAPSAKKTKTNTAKKTKTNTSTNTSTNTTNKTTVSNNQLIRNTMNGSSCNFTRRGYNTIGPR